MFINKTFFKMSKKNFTASFILEEKLPNPLSKAARVLDEEGILTQERSASEVIHDLSRICGSLSMRLGKVQEYERWQWGGEMCQPTYYDDFSKETRSARYALYPCPLVNNELNRLVRITLQRYSTENIGNILDILHYDRNHSELAVRLRDISIKSEEAMEKDALELIFAH